MRKLFVVFILLAQTLTAIAAPFQQKLDGLFSKLIEPKVLDRVNKSIVGINLGVNCTANYISNDYMLTALHCLEICFIGTNLKIELPDGASGTLINKKIPGRCLSLPMAELAYGQTLPSYTVVAVGARGVLDPDTTNLLMKKNPEVMRDLLKDQFSGEDAENDFAILKVANANEHSCLSVAPKAPQPGHVVWNLSYPYFERLKSVNTGWPTYSFGRISRSLDDNMSLSAEEKALYKSVYEVPEIFFSSLDSETGSSGSAVLDTSGKIVGLTISVLKTTKEYSSDSTKSIRIEHIMQNLKDQFGAKKTAEFFRCDIK
jgi:hypothetical protein